MQRAIVTIPALAILTFAAATVTHQVVAADADPAVQKTFTRLITALESNDRAAFVEGATDEVREGMTEGVMAAASKLYASRLKKGYTATYFGELKTQGHQVYLWRLRYQDDGDDQLARLALKDGKVGGFFIVP